MTLLATVLLLVGAPAPSTPVRATWIHPLDYPAALLPQRKEGRVDFRLTFGDDGRLAGCAISKSSGDMLLDATTCRLSARRARVAAGQPRTADYFVDWRVPDPR